MSNQYNTIFQVPERSLIMQRLTKAFFLRNFKLTTPEKKLLNDTVKSMEIVAQINLDKSNIPPIANETDSYENILIILCTIPDNQLEMFADSCIQLIQKYIAHQVVLVIEDSTEFIISVADKRINQVDKNYSSRKSIQYLNFIQAI